MPAWLRQYPRIHLHSDLLAGVVTSVLVLPQNLAYALLAGLPPQAGLLASVFPVMAYALWGSSMTQAVGPVAVTSIIAFAVLSPLAVPFSPQYVVLAACLALFSGLLSWAFGLMRLGYLSNLLSRPVVSGFISGSAVLIVVSQLKALFGLDVHGPDSWRLMWDLFVLRGGAGPHSTGGGDPIASCGGTQTNYASGNLDQLIVMKIKRELKSLDADPSKIPGLLTDENAKPCDQRVAFWQQ